LIDGYTRSGADHPQYVPTEFLVKRYRHYASRATNSGPWDSSAARDRIRTGTVVPAERSQRIGASDRPYKRRTKDDDGDETSIETLRPWRSRLRVRPTSHFAEIQCVGCRRWNNATDLV
jgi:hypothetical protein